MDETTCLLITKSFIFDNEELYSSKKLVIASLFSGIGVELYNNDNNNNFDASREANYSVSELKILI